MHHRYACYLLAYVLSTSASFGATLDDRVDELPEKYRKWLQEEVTYIISDVEREAFLNLVSEQERETFIDVFWRKRDPNPTTLENEFRTEHYERLAYANEFLGRSTFRKGWQTDRGRYYILLGPPRNIQNFEHEDSVYPTELWFYNDAALERFGLPPFFFLLFVRRDGGGELELYSPNIDGPKSLLTGYQTASTNISGGIEEAYQKLWEIHPDLAQASISFRTDEGDTATFQRSSFGTIALLEDIRQAPFRGVDTSYATRLDFERGVVESDYLFRYVPSFGMMSVLPGPENSYYLHWAIELDARYVGLVKDEDRAVQTAIFVTTIQMTPRGDADTVVLDARKESFMRLRSEDVEKSKHQPYSYRGMTPVVPGSYDVRIIFRNRACPSRDESECYKSYTLLEGPVEVPDWRAGQPRLSGPVLAYATERPDAKSLYRPYRFGSLQVLPNPRRVYAIDEPVVFMTDALDAPPKGSIRSRIYDRRSPDRIVAERRDSLDGLQLEPLVPEMTLADAEGGRYRLLVELLDAAGNVLDAHSEEFEVTPRTLVARPGIRGSWPQVAAEIPGMVQSALGEQYFGLNQNDEAREHFETALKQNPKLGPAREHLASMLLDEGKTGRAIELLEPIYQAVPDRFEVIILLGEGYFQEKNYKKAAELLERAVTLRRPEPRWLNHLARSHYALGHLDRARELLTLSLSLKADQPEVKELMGALGVEPAP